MVLLHNFKIYNWLISYFEGRDHATKFNGQMSNKRCINASVVQGSTGGPFSYSVAASDLKPKNVGFYMFKFADDMDLVTTVDHYGEVPNKLEHIDTWAFENNMILNKNKTKEIIFRNRRMNVSMLMQILGVQHCAVFKVTGGEGSA